MRSLSKFETFSRLPLWKRGVAAAGVVVLYIIARVGIQYYKAAKNKHAKPGIAVGVATAALGDMPVYLSGLGTVTAYYTVTVQAQVGGQLLSVNFKEGQFVHKGDVLAQIDPRPFQAQLDQAQGQLAKDQALLDDAKLDLARYKGLLAQNAIPSQQYDTQVATVGQDNGVVESDKAAVETAKLNLAYARITSPIDGRMGLRLVDPGNIVTANSSAGLFVITQLQPITVVFTLPEDDIPEVMRTFRAGQKMLAEAYNRDMSEKLATGSLLAVDNEINSNTGTLNFKAVFDNKDGVLFPNQFVNVKLLLNTLHNQVIVPSAAIQTGAQGTFVYVVGQDGTVSVQNVAVGTALGTNTAVSSGLKAGDVVVTDGVDNIQPGSKVKVEQQPSAAAPPANGAANVPAQDVANTQAQSGQQKRKHRNKAG